MTLWKASVAGLLCCAGLVMSAQAQIPTAPPIPGAGSSALGSGVSSLAGAGSAQKTIWGFFGLSKANCQACKEKFCASNLGMMVNSAMGPLSGLSGGLLGSCCPTVPSAAQQAAIAAGPGGPNGAAAVAAKIKASEADAKARVAAVEYLGTVDCQRWPEASKALVAALRGDQNECVRYAAARVLNNGCCCTKETITALRDTLASEPGDKLPVETSDRVRAAAMVALQRCQFLNPERLETKEERETAPPPPPTPGRERSTSSVAVDKNVEVAGLNSSDPDVRLSAYIAKVRRKPAAEVLTEARQELVKAQRQGPAPIMLTGNRSLYDAIVRARRTPQAPVYQQNQANNNAPAMAPAPPAASIPLTTESDPSVVGTSATVPADAPQRTAPRSLSDVFLRSRNR